MDASGPQYISTLAALLENAIDYAGLFPPAKLSMSAAVTNYAAYIAEESAWMLGRFIVPVARLEEFEASAEGLLPGPGRRPWHLSALSGGGPLAGAIPEIRAFNQRHTPSVCPGQAVIDVIELKAESAGEILRDEGVDTELIRYYELPVDEEPDALLAAVARVGGRAKMRTGGISEDAFPTAEQVARFLAACVRSRVPCKATAGLHHPMRGMHRLTYEPNSPSGMMFGFLNVFLAGAFLAAGMSEDDAVHVLEERAPDAFSFDDDGVTWRGYRLSPEQLRRARRLNTISFGSCSFLEPVEELRELGML